MERQAYAHTYVHARTDRHGHPQTHADHLRRIPRTPALTCTYSRTDTDTHRNKRTHIHTCTHTHICLL